jgi:hypothetical protein
MTFTASYNSSFARHSQNPTSEISLYRAGLAAGKYCQAKMGAPIGVDRHA